MPEPDTTQRIARDLGIDGAEFANELALVTPELQHAVGINRDDLASLLLLEGLKGFGPQKFKELRESRLRPIDVLLEPHRLPIGGKRGDAFREAISGIDAADRHVAQARAVRQLVRAHEHRARIVTYDDPLYPPNVYSSNNPIPVLYARGNLELLTYDRAVACVGSRDIAEPYSALHYEFARHAVARRFAIVSGFALGADTLGHRAAYDSHGATVLVMPCGLDRPFPPENRELFDELRHYPGAVAVSEFAFGTAASALTLRKRNKLIVAFARGALVSQSSASGGAMNAYRFGREQRKPVATFATDGEARTSGNALIESDEERNDGREGRRRFALSDARRSTVFPADRPHPEAWDAWLQQLSSST